MQLNHALIIHPQVIFLNVYLVGAYSAVRFSLHDTDWLMCSE